LMSESGMGFSLEAFIASSTFVASSTSIKHEGGRESAQRRL
jgi:hypothetical protein